MAIPFKSLRYRGRAQQVWGVNIRRSSAGRTSRRTSPRCRGVGRARHPALSQAATLVGLEAPPPSLNLEVKPYGIGRSRPIAPSTRRSSNDLDGDAGFDLKYGLTQSLTADFTYRTDFAQVEDDEQQVNLTRFNLFVPEKREFFLEGQGIFAFGGARPRRRDQRPRRRRRDTPVLFFSRRVGLSGSHGCRSRPAAG